MVIKPLCFCPLGIGYSRVMIQVTFDLRLISIRIVDAEGISRTQATDRTPSRNPCLDSRTRDTRQIIRQR
jgi:hypothetical protein